MTKTIKPKPATHLSAEAKALWRRLFADYQLDDAAGLVLLQSACEAYDRLQEARKVLAEDGAVMTDRWGQKKPHPAAGIERDARNQLHSALRLLKLEPGADE
jgi:P27 family predicted phage terminase small subunit